MTSRVDVLPLLWLELQPPLHKSLRRLDLTLRTLLLPCVVNLEAVVEMTGQQTSSFFPLDSPLDQLIIFHLSFLMSLSYEAEILVCASCYILAALLYQRYPQFVLGLAIALIVAGILIGHELLFQRVELAVKR